MTYVSLISLSFSLLLLLHHQQEPGPAQGFFLLKGNFALPVSPAGNSFDCMNECNEDELNWTEMESDTCTLLYTL